MRRNQTIKRLIATCCLPALLGGCAADAGQFPSLAIRDSERVTGSMQPPENAWVPPPAPPEALGQLAGLQAQARMAHDAFLAQANDARRLVGAGSGAQQGTDAWANAHIALAELQSTRAPALVALAELDAFYAAVLTEGAQAEEIATVRETVLAMVTDEERLIGELGAELVQ